MARKSRNIRDNLLVIELVIIILFWFVFLGMMLKQENMAGMLIGIFVFGMIGWGVGIEYIPRWARNIVLALLGVAAIVFMIPVAERWEEILLSGAVIVFAVAICELFPRYHHGRRVTNKERRKRIPLWHDMLGYACWMMLMSELIFWLA